MSVYLNVLHHMGCYRSQKRVVNLLEPELKMVVSPKEKKKIVVSRCVGFRTELVFSAEASSPFDY